MLKVGRGQLLGEEKQVVFIHCHMPTIFYQLRLKLKSVASVLKRLLTIKAPSSPLVFPLKKSYETIKFEGRFD